MSKITYSLLIVLLGSYALFFTTIPKILEVKSGPAFRIEEPLLITGEQHYFSILPTGTVVYFDRGWPEGHLTYHVYFNIKGEIQTKPANREIISPLWLRTVESEELPKLLNDYPVTKEELVDILKARKIKKSDLVKILNDWRD